MSRPHVRLLGQGIRYLSTLRGGGSAFPGLVMERLHPGFVAEELAKLPHGVVLISGTNGKTTTTKMAVQLLRSQGYKVFTNRTGSNFVRGVAAALLGEMSLTGRLDADIAVLELDEAHAVHFVKQVKPRHALLLNVMRDQLDRFGEIDTTRRMLAQIAAATTGTVVLNREDPRIVSLAEHVPEGTQTRWFGLSAPLRPMFPSDDDMAVGVQKAIEQARRTDVKLVVGGAGSKDYIKKVMDGDKVVTADVTYSPRMIAEAMKLTAEARVKGTAMPATTIIPSVLITKDNAKEHYFPDSPF